MKRPTTYFRSTFSKWLIPYILLIVVTIGFGVLLYHQALRTVEEDVWLIQRASLSRIQEQVDELLDSLDLLGYSICSSMEGTALKQMAEGTYSVLQTEHSRGLQEDLKTWCASYDVLSELNVYFPGRGGRTVEPCVMASVCHAGFNQHQLRPAWLGADTGMLSGNRRAVRVSELFWTGGGFYRIVSGLSETGAAERAA